MIYLQSTGIVFVFKLLIKYYNILPLVLLLLILLNITD